MPKTPRQSRFCTKIVRLQIFCRLERASDGIHPGQAITLFRFSIGAMFGRHVVTSVPQVQVRDLGERAGPSW